MKTLILSLLSSVLLVSAPALAGDDHRSGTTDIPEAADPAADTHPDYDDRYRGTDGASAGERGYDDDDDGLPGRVDDDRDDEDDD